MRRNLQSYEEYVGIFSVNTQAMVGYFIADVNWRCDISENPLHVSDQFRKTYVGENVSTQTSSTDCLDGYKFLVKRSGETLCVGIDDFISSLKDRGFGDGPIDEIVEGVKSKFREATGGMNEKVDSARRLVDKAFGNQELNTPSSRTVETHQRMDAQSNSDQPDKTFNELMEKIKSQKGYSRITFKDGSCTTLHNTEFVYIRELQRSPYDYFFPDHITHLINDSDVRYIQRIRRGAEKGEGDD